MSELESIIEKLITHPNIKHRELLSEALSNLIELDALDNPHDLKISTATLRELKEAHLIFKKYPQRKVSIFGSARTQPNNINYTLAETVAKELVKSQFMVVTGAGPGIMEAANKGAGAEHSFGLDILLPFEQCPNHYIKDDPKCLTHQYFYTRKLNFLKHTDATIIFPGGYGTLDEAFELLTLLQTGKCAPRPIILMTHPNSKYWQEFTTYIENQLHQKRYISDDCLKMVQFTTSPQKATQIIEDFYTIYHSLRYIANCAVIRLNTPLTENQLQQLNDEFSAICVSGSIQQFPGHEVENDIENYPEKTKLVFKFGSKSYTHLNSMIHRISTFNQK